MKHNKTAFTLLEMTFVIVVLGILGAIAIPKLAATRDDAITAKVKKQINAIRMGIAAERQERIQRLKGMENTSEGTLWLYYDYQPWNGQTYSANGKKVMIMQNVDTFQFKAIGDLIKIQLCVKDANIAGGYSICKEKTIF